MPNYTNNYSLIKPKKGENYDVNETTGKNMDIIDTELHKKVEKQAGKGLSSNDFTDPYKNKLDTLTNVYTFKGSKETYGELQEDENKVGDVWAITDEGTSYAWNGSNWNNIGSNLDLTIFVKKDEFNNKCVPSRRHNRTSFD